MTGHELSVHTWSHPVRICRLYHFVSSYLGVEQYLTSLTNEQIVAELGWTRLAIQTITGVTPVTMRPPYGDIGEWLFRLYPSRPITFPSVDDRVRAIALAMGMVPIIWTRAQDGSQFDTNGMALCSTCLDRR